LISEGELFLLDEIRHLLRDVDDFPAPNSRANVGNANTRPKRPAVIALDVVEESFWQ